VSASLVDLRRQAAPSAPLTIEARPQSITLDIARTMSPQYCIDATIYNVAQCYGFVTTSSALMGEQ
jgi:hypothetical protein